MFYRFRRSLRALLPKLNRELFYVHYLKEIPAIESKIPIRIELLKKEYIHKINAVKKFDLQRLYLRLERGDLCYAAVTIEHDKIVSYHWVQEKGLHFIQQADRFELIKKNEACIYHVRVSDDFKGNRINGAVYAEILRKSKVKGINKVWVYTNINNFSNRKGLEALGFEIDYKIYSLFFNNKYYQIYKKLT
jgi:hypothetical protein